MDHIRDKCIELLWINAELLSTRIYLFETLSLTNTTDNTDILQMIKDFEHISDTLTSEIINETGMSKTQLLTHLKTYTKK
jgi:uncharacterized protein Yka (UPF0111/DUF47 family)